jgi:hypothetical protein
MSRAEAQFILRAYRANGTDENDPQFREALDLAKQDPELARWFADELALDTAVAGKILSMHAPPDLKVQLLLAGKTVRPVSWWRKPARLAAAACIAALLAISSWLMLRRPGREDFAHFRHAMVQASLDMKSHYDVMGLNADQLKYWISEHHGDNDYVLPVGLAGKQIAGCKVFDWHGHQVTLLCFKFDGKHVDLLVVNEDALPGLSLGVTPQFAWDSGLSTAAWRRDGKIYFLAGNIAKPELNLLL